jgi:hypothetical protein
MTLCSPNRYSTALECPGDRWREPTQCESELLGSISLIDNVQRFKANSKTFALNLTRIIDNLQTFRANVKRLSMIITRIIDKINRFIANLQRFSMIL